MSDKMAKFGSNNYGSWGKESIGDKLRSSLSGNVEAKKFLEKLGLVDNEKKKVGPVWFNYSAISAQGIRRKGKMQATSIEAVSEALQADGWIPLDIVEILSKGLNTDLGAALGSNEAKLSLEELATFVRQLAELIRAGVPVTRALSSLGEENTSTINKICTELINEVQSGVPLSKAMGSFPKVFDEVFTSYVEAGEQTGNLAITLQRLAKTIEKQASMAQKIKGVTAYPKFVSIAIFGVVTGIILFMVPMYAKIYESFGKKLPTATLALMTVSRNVLPMSFTKSFPMPWFVTDPKGLSTVGLIGRVIFAIVSWMLFEVIRIKRGKDASTPKRVMRTIAIAYISIFGYNYQWHLAPFAIFIFVASSSIAYIAYRQKNINNLEVIRKLDGLKYRVPLFGNIWRYGALFRWSSTLAGALGSGVTMISALELASKTTGSLWHKLVSRELQASVRAGKPLSEGLANYPDLYPPSVRAMVSTGESTGDLPTMLDSISLTIDSETDALIAGLAAKIEVVLLISMATIVGGLLMVLYLPILNLASAGFGGE
jgi:general secretion pathway protein F